MNRVAVKLLLPLLLGLSLAACHRHHGGSEAAHAGSGAHGSGVHFDFGHGDIAYDKHTIVIRVDGQPGARVTPEGKLSLDEKPVTLTPDGEAALARYYSTGRAFGNQAVQVGMDGADFAMHTLGKVFTGLLHGDPDKVEEDARQGGEALKDQVRVLCRMLEDWRVAQDAAATAAPQFAPYTAISPQDAERCMDDEDHDDPQAAAAGRKT